MISLSVVLYKTKRAVVLRLLDSCIATTGISLSVCVVDNSPTDEYRDLVEGYGFRYLHRPDNPGYGASHNFAFRHVGHNSKCHFILNPDISFGPNALAELVGYMDRDAGVGLLMPKVIYPDGTLQYLCKLLPTPTNLLLRRFVGHLRLAKKIDAEFELRFTGYDKVMDVPYLSGCFMLVRSSLYREIGGFDEQFFMYFEDLDLTRRFGRRAKTIYFPPVTVTHEFSKGSYKFNRLFLIHIASAIRYFNKWGWFYDRDRKVINKRTLNQFE